MTVLFCGSAVRSILKGGEVMDAGASHPSGFFRKLNRKRRVMNYEQRNFCKTPCAAPVQSCQKHSGCDERSGYSLTSFRSGRQKNLHLLFRLIPKDKAAEVFANMNNSMQTYLVEMFSEKELKELLDDLYMDDTVDLLEELPANLVNRILDTVNQSDRNLINQLLNYPDDSAGSIMTTE